MPALQIKRDRAWWQAHLQRIDQEGIATKDYAEREGLSARQLYDKRKAFKLQAARTQTTRTVTKSARASFVALQVVPDAGTERSDHALGCTLVLPAGVRLEMVALPSPQWLAALSVDLAGAGR